MSSAVCAHISGAATSGGIAPGIGSNSKIYKDDCMYNFDTAENNSNGLDVCLSCFQAFSRSDHDINYTLKHGQLQSHELFLNIVKTLKPEAQEEMQKPQAEENEEREKKIAKLEIKESKESDFYDIINSIYCLKCDHKYAIGESPIEVQSLVNQILAANSTNRNDEIKAWEQEILPCEHSIDLQQTPYSDEIDLTLCGQCDLKENLWICLHCGKLGCGRKQFGSELPGNSHALSHYEVSQHPVAIKLGSLSADDANSCDAYCYQCNDEVKVPGLSEKLLKYGIDINSRTKTEKNLIELNLEQNLNWDFKLDGANGEKLKPLFGKDCTGFQNLGNSCYLNSVVQSLFSLQDYDDFFKSKDFDEKVKDPAVDLESQLIKLYKGLKSGNYLKPNKNVFTSKGDQYQMGIKPSAFKTLIGENHPEFQTQRQQDAFEFMLYLLDKLDNQYGFALNKNLKFLMGNKVICSNCDHGKLNHELVDNLSVPVNAEVLKVEEDGTKIYEEISLNDCFRDYCSTQEIEGYQCDECNAKSTALQSSGFKTYPKYLVVNAKRIKLENWVPVKVDIPIKLEDSIDLKQYEVPKFSNGEVEVKGNSKTNEPTTFAANEEAMATLLSMGFTETRCLKALCNTGNSNAEDAMNWIFAHMEDADIDEPFDPSASTNNAGAGNEPSAELIENLMAMGFAHALARKALILNGGDVNVAVEWLFNNPDDDGIIEEGTDKPVVNIQAETETLTEELLNQPEPSNTRYAIKSVICHKGTSPHTGHYVAFIKKLVDGERKWVLFNDEKVVECDDKCIEDIENNGYIYIFERV
ncbi:ubiquitinyl hydrolase [Hyphopichia burtonii NRRL Y-1933]|uniref:Ubiquitin carboxyl-terminal hydrolase n=1 Tax=Hyphopichia burtonii NRRL Y-1933 TaxID=984485 RepID=A0A1E4RN91_9ASCO|nr:ubiquitinyl hydrolase [Hyphopichia burtonii NRRL Y-1933]ODV68706.1 ubiquitinyl hydrolase [Hyphopichia burtonii NRRL Y-1933]